MISIPSFSSILLFESIFSSLLYKKSDSINIKTTVKIMRMTLENCALACVARFWIIPEKLLLLSIVSISACWILIPILFIVCASLPILSWNAVCIEWKLLLNSIASVPMYPPRIMMGMKETMMMKMRETTFGICFF